ncbi:MAG: hypothetical protein FJ038_00735 [Chloroflexi bacterium]|nr:hypothetical protein [Chloroflexota bacterium]
MSTLDAAPQIQFDGRDEWRAWLEANHATSGGVWVATWRSSTGRPRLEYEPAIEEAFCFGWVDGQGGTVDANRGKLYFAPRRRGSPWATSNKGRVERLLAAGRMAPSGIAAVERAKADGSWTVFDSAARLEEPPELIASLDARPHARDHWNGFTVSVRRMSLEYIALAKRPETRQRRADAIAEAAARNASVVGGGSQ